MEVPVELGVSDYYSTFFDVLLIVHFSIILAIDQINALILVGQLLRLLL